MHEFDALLALIRNDAWMVRNYSRGVNRLQREQAILKFGNTVRHVFAQLEHATPAEYEAILAAIIEGLRPLERAIF